MRDARRIKAYSLRTINRKEMSLPGVHTIDELLRELDDDGESYFSSGRQNNITDLALSISAILASLVATVLAASGQVTPWISATAAAVPAACASLQRVVDFRGRSSWYFQHAARVRALAITLRYAKAPGVEEFARKRGELEIEMEKDWSHIGRSGAAPITHRRKATRK
jgi:hypothetical protein